MGLLNIVRDARSKFITPLLTELRHIRNDARRISHLQKEEFLARLLSDARYADPLRLEPFGWKVYSQFDEDGILHEIFNRIGLTNRKFVEFGIGNGLENNTAALLLNGWSGLWLDGNAQSVEFINEKFANVISEKRLTIHNAFITKDNINQLIGQWTSGEIDLLSIDIDGNDFYVLDAIDVIKPRVIVAEYNAKFHPSMSIIQAYNEKHRYAGTDYYGMSLRALEHLGRKKGYALVGCNFAGANAFLVREDLASEKFQAPFTAENHYQPARYFLWQLYTAGHSYSPDWGDFVSVDDKGSPRPIA